MKITITCLTAAALALLWPGQCLPEGAPSRSAFPSPLPTDITFEKVIAEFPYPGIRFPVPIIGWKHHPQEIHVTPSGALVLPTPRTPAALYLAPLIAIDGGEPSLFDAESVTQSLVDGFKPGIYSYWKTGSVKVEQAAFGSLLEGREVLTGNEPLLGLVRYTITNTSKAPVRGELLLNFTEGPRGIRAAGIGPAYPGRLAFSRGMVAEEDGSAALCVLGSTLGPVSFTSAPAADKPGGVLYLNQEMATVQSPEYAITVTRSGDAVKSGEWSSPDGMDLTCFSPALHSSPLLFEVRIAGADGRAIGFLGTAGIAEKAGADAGPVPPGRQSGPLPWSRLKDVLPQGESRIIVTGHYPAAGGYSRVLKWEPAFALTRPNVRPVFRKEGDIAKDTLHARFQLAPGRSRSLEIAVPYFPLRGEQAAKLRTVSLQQRLAEFRGYWEKELNRNAQFVVPEKRVRDSYRACLANNLLLVDRDPETRDLLMHPDATEYENVWGGDGSVIMQAMDWLGYHSESAGYSRYLLRRQGVRAPEGDVDSAEGFLTGDVGLRWMSENGFVLWALCEHYRLTGDRQWLKQVAPKIAASADWIVRQRARTKTMEDGERVRHWGLLPKGRPSDLSDWDNWYWTDTYSYMGLSRAAEVLRDAGMAAQADRFRREAEDYRECICESLRRSINRNVSPPFVPSSPYKNADPTSNYLFRWWYPICSPIYMVEAGILDAHSDEAGWTEYWLEKLGMISGLPALGADMIDPHYCFNSALAELLRGETDKFVWTLYSLLAFGQSRGTYATIEGTNIATGTYWSDVWDAHRQPHMHSNSRVIGMLRIALLLEEGARLHLMAGTPRHWLEDGRTVEVRRAPSLFGAVSYRAVSSIAKGVVTVAIEPPERREAEVVLHVRPPGNRGRLRSVTVNGRPWNRFAEETVELGRLRGSATVRCVFH